MFFFMGTTLTLALVLTAFEWKSYEKVVLKDLGDLNEVFENVIDIPLTEQSPPPPPVVELPIIKVVEDEVEIDDVDIEIDTEITEETVIEDIEFTEEPEPEVIEKVFTIVEQNPAFPGGQKAMYDFLNKNINYPSQARRMGIDGRVFVQFIIDKDGTITDVKSIKGIGAGCDEEAKRVIQMMPRWNPGKQRGNPVKVKLTIPVFFKLNN